MTDKKKTSQYELDDTKLENLKKKKKQKRELKDSEDENYLDELLEDVEDDSLYHLMKKIKFKFLAKCHVIQKVVS